MEQNFSLMAQSRANYYTAGSPVQFVRVELLKGDLTGEVAVCLTFKNVGTEPLTGLVIHFKCKDAAGQILCEDDFYYEQLDVQPGELFGSDDAVYVSDVPISSVEIEQDRAFLNARGVDLRAYKRVRLTPPRVLPGTIAQALQANMGNDALTCLPQDTEYGWFCACGAFHPNEENVQVCSECGGDRVTIKAELTRILEEQAARQATIRQQRISANAQPVAAPQPEPTPAPVPTPVEEPAPVAASDPVPGPVAAPTAAAAAAAITAAAVQEAIAQEEEANAYPMETEEEVRRFIPKEAPAFDAEPVDLEETGGTRMFDTTEGESYDDDYEDDEYDDRSSKGRRGRYADDDEESDEDVMADRIIRWAPPITAVICAMIIAGSLFYHFVMA